MKIRLFSDVRDFFFHEKFGSTTDFSDEMNFDDVGIPEKIQSIGNVECTAYGCVYCATNLTHKEYNIDDLFDRYPSDNTGADPRVALGEAVKGGFLPINAQIREKPFESYWSAHTDKSQIDAFDSTRSAMVLANSPCLLWTNWYTEWNGLLPNFIIPQGQNRISGHFYALKGWTTKNNTPYFIVEFWGGYTILMSREIFNFEIARWGCGTAILSTAQIDQKRIKTIMEILIDMLKNLILDYRELLKKKI